MEREKKENYPDIRKFIRNFRSSYYFGEFNLLLLPFSEEETYKRAEKMLNNGWSSDKILSECTIFSVPQHGNSIRIPVFHLVAFDHPITKEWDNKQIYNAVYEAAQNKISDEKSILLQRELFPFVKHDVWDEIIPPQIRINLLISFSNHLLAMKYFQDKNN